ncbi:MAG: hypothetical protein IJ688_04140 [Treponema sp.]|nr:hypothetical protein [Treponema sp.]
MVFKSASRNDSYTVLTEAVDENEWFIEQIKLGNLLYQNKQKSLEWTSERGLPLPSRLTTQGSLNVIQKEDIVNKRTPNFNINDRKIEFTENQQEFLKSIGFNNSVNSDGNLDNSSFYKEDSKNEKIYLNVKHLENNDITIFVNKNNTDYPIFDNTKKNFFEFSLISTADSEEKNFIPLVVPPSENGR